MDEERIIDRVIEGYSIGRALYYEGDYSSLRRYIKNIEVDISEDILRNYDKDILISYLNHKKKIKKAISTLKTHVNLIRMKLKIVSYIFIAVLSILTSVLYVLQKFLDRISFFILPNYDIIIVVIFSINTLLLYEYIYSYFCIERMSLKRIVLKTLLYLLFSYILIKLMLGIVSI